MAANFQVTSRQISALKNKGINNLMQIHRWIPLRYLDNTVETGVDESMDGSRAVIIGRLIKVEQKPMRSGNRSFIMSTIVDRISGKKVRVMHFIDSFAMFNKFRSWVGNDVIAAGKVQYQYPYGFSLSPDTFSIHIDWNMKVFPVYSKIRGISGDKLSDLLRYYLNQSEPDSVNSALLAEYGLTDINTALRNVMRPRSIQDVENGKKRLLFDDLYYLAARFTLSERETPTEGIKITDTSVPETVIDHLPFKLTNGQMETYEKIRDEMLLGHHLKALVQGDVGCGKTITAFLAMLLAAGNGHQTAIMAPTKILAEQHYKKLTDLLDGTNLKAALISGKAPGKKLLKEIADGDVNLIVGTQGLLSDKIQFCDLGLLVIDEEHKFGVEQRQKIAEKIKTVDTISMSATPIPRTLAHAVFGRNTMIFSIKDMPAGRKKVMTQWDDGSHISNIGEHILSLNQQIYVVCPMITEADDESQLSDVISTHEALQKYRELFPNAKVEELNGTTSPADTEKILSKFHNGDIDILVSTTVVEVGVDVPNATLMIIENAERFGLAGMHQLRGRVGRGSEQAYCLLISKETPDENERLKTLINTTDGFEIAEKDLTMLRKSGNLFGNEQSGRNKYVEEMVMYPNLYKEISASIANLESKELENHATKMEYSEVRGKMKPIDIPEYTKIRQPV
jgi:ATP-dependent DNA helicase RecG